METIHPGEVVVVKYIQINAPSMKVCLIVQIKLYFLVFITIREKIFVDCDGLNQVMKLRNNALVKILWISVTVAPVTLNIVPEIILGLIEMVEES